MKLYQVREKSTNKIMLIGRRPKKLFTYFPSKEIEEALLVKENYEVVILETVEVGNLPL